jgi:hypothetical protein
MLNNTDKFQRWGSSTEQTKKLQEVTSLEHRESLETIRNIILREVEGVLKCPAKKDVSKSSSPDQINDLDISLLLYSCTYPK